MPPFLLNLLFSKWSWIALGFMVISSYAGYQKWQHERWAEKYESYRIEIQALGKAAEEKAKETKTNQDKATKEVRHETTRDRARISRYYGDGLRLKSSGGGSMPPTPNGSKGVNDAPAESGVGGTSFEGKCALDAEQVMKFQALVRKWGLPVE